jgi:hypothetical protein
MGCSMTVVDAGVPCWAHSVEESSLLMRTFLKTNTCSALVCPLACALREEEPWSVQGHLRGEYTTAIDGQYTRRGAPLRSVAPIEHLLDVIEADGRSRVRW